MIRGADRMSMNAPGKHNTKGFDVYSLGQNGKGGDEAIGNWTSP